MSRDRASVRIGLLGGTFDPIHHGHLVAAEEAAWALDLGRVLFLPAAAPPHKERADLSPIADRVAMVALATRGNKLFGVSLVDAERDGPAYSVDTLRILKQSQIGDVDYFFIVGLDSLADLPKWHLPGELLSLARLVAVSRPGYGQPDWDALEQALPGCRERTSLVPIPELAISSSDIRERVFRGQPIRYQVPPMVERYIAERGLYRG